MNAYYFIGAVLLATVQFLPIDATSCKNGGSPLHGNYAKCSCAHGYKGYDCAQQVSPCEGKPCRNYATCVEQENGHFTCTCPENYEGILCEKKVLPCDKHPCKNSGKCTNVDEKCFKCECQQGFKGSDCSEKIRPCEVFPCKNGGVCSNEGDAGFKCACKRGFGGMFCERKDVLFSSLILNGDKEYVDKLESWLKDGSDWRLCYRASRDGWKASDFHGLCDGRPGTVSLISANGNIFGGYSDLAWGGSTGYRTSSKSFLFSLRNKKGQAFKADIYKNNGNAIYNRADYGPTFGGGHDLQISNNANTNINSYTNFGHTYRPPFGYSYNTVQAKTILPGVVTGGNKFTPSEIEVYYLV